jgi:hypothetical protein
MISMTGPGGFAPFHRWDRTAFLVLVVGIWIGIVGGFVPDMVRHVTQNKPAYLPIVHVHAAAFMGWLVLLTVQTWLVRTKRIALHRKLGLMGGVLIAAMLYLGPVTAFAVQKLRYGEAGANIAFLSVQLGDMLAFAVLAIAGLLARSRSSAHKRLMMLATFPLTEAGFGRMLFGPLHRLLGDGFWPLMAQNYLGPNLLILALGAYDLATRRRLHPAYVAAAAFILVVEMVATALYLSPGWPDMARRIVGA